MGERCDGHQEKAAATGGIKGKRAFRTQPEKKTESSGKIKSIFPHLPPKHKINKKYIRYE